VFYVLSTFLWGRDVTSFLQYYSAKQEKENNPLQAVAGFEKVLQLFFLSISFCSRSFWATDV
jgi:hypothetical protein